MALLEYRDVVKLYKNTAALKGVNLDIPSGRIVGLLGPNGSGKTTLLKITAGLLTPDKGTVKIDGADIGVITKASVSFLPERTYLADRMSVKEAIDFIADFYSDFDKVKAYEMLSRLAIDPGRRLKTLSKGTKEKVQLILVMSRNAKLYLLDEPIAGVDPAAREYILNTIIGNYSENSTVVISTHLILDIESVLDDVVFINDGNVVLADTVDRIRQERGMTVDMLFREVFRC